MGASRRRDGEREPSESRQLWATIKAHGLADSWRAWQEHVPGGSRATATTLARKWLEWCEQGLANELRGHIERIILQGSQIRSPNLYLSRIMADEVKSLAGALEQQRQLELSRAARPLLQSGQRLLLADGRTAQVTDQTDSATTLLTDDLEVLVIPHARFDHMVADEGMNRQHGGAA